MTTCFGLNFLENILKVVKLFFPSRTFTSIVHLRSMAFHIFHCIELFLSYK